MYARENITPTLSEGATRLLVKAYVEMRQLGSSRRVVTATPRQLDSLIRISESLAKMRYLTLTPCLTAFKLNILCLFARRFSESVDEQDVHEATRYSVAC
jgi:hypothetical protein